MKTFFAILFLVLGSNAFSSAMMDCPMGQMRVAFLLVVFIVGKVILNKIQTVLCASTINNNQ